MDRKGCLTFCLKSKEVQIDVSKDKEMYKEIFLRLKILISFGR